MAKLTKPMDLMEKLEALFTKEKMRFRNNDSDGFIMLRFLATDPDYVEVAQALSFYMLSSKVSTSMAATFLQKILPKGGKFRSKASLKKGLFDTGKVNGYLKKLFSCTDVQAFQIRAILEDQGYNLTQIFGVQEEQ